MDPEQFRKRVGRLLILASVAVWIVCAIRPLNVEAWVLEQVATVVGVAFLYWLSQQVRLGSWAMCGIALLFITHTIGTHYTYSLTPYNSFFTDVFGTGINELLGFERNHYDRLVHFIFGVACAAPLAQFFFSLYRTSVWSAHVLTGSAVLAVSALYELMEWGAAVVFGGDLGVAYLGTQGDVWDAQVDMALAGLGWLLTALSVRSRLQMSERKG